MRLVVIADALHFRFLAIKAIGQDDFWMPTKCQHNGSGSISSVSPGADGARFYV